MLKAVVDLATLLIRHPAWAVGAAARGLAKARAEGTARYKYGLRRLYHHHIYRGLERMPVEIGGASYVEPAKALIVARFCKLLNAKRVLEIGTFRGGMTAHIARNTSVDCEIFTLDLPRENLPAVASEMIPHDVALAQMDPGLVGTEWRAFPERSKVRQLWGDSNDLRFQPPRPVRRDLCGRFTRRTVGPEGHGERICDAGAPTGAILWDDALWSDVQRVLGRFARTPPIYLFEDDNTAGYLQFEGKPVQV